GSRRAHGLGYGERPDAFWPLFAGDVRSLNDRTRRRTAGSHDDPGPWVLDILFLEARIRDGLLHGNVVPGRALAHEPRRAAVEHLKRIEFGRPMYLAAEVEIRIFLGKDDAGSGRAQALQDFGNIVADRRDDSHTGDD